MNDSRPGFEADVKPLFRDSDRRAMTFMFDLGEYEDVKANAAAILAAVSSGEMPCDGDWADEQVARFKAWMDGGFAP
jgi:hypothetical protein